MAPQFANLVLIPEEGGRLRQFRIPVWPVWALALAGFVFLACLVGAGAAYWQLARSRQVLAAVMTENEVLRNDLVELGEQITGLGRTVRDHIHLANESRLLAGLLPYGEEVAMLGVGGTPLGEASQPPDGVSPGLHRALTVFNDRIEQLSRQLDFQEGSFVEVRQLLEANRDRLDHIPTINPVMGRHYMSSGFGMRRDPFTGQRVHHAGLDFCAPTGTPLRATADGVVVFAGNNGGFGKTIKIDHGNDYRTVYAHCNTLQVKKGQKVRRGDIVGEVGDSGRSTGSHLHYEVHKDGRAVNPRRYLLEANTVAG